MAIVTITEYARAKKLEMGPNVLQIAEEPPITTQTMTITAGSTQSAAFNAGTNFIRIDTDAIIRFEIGANPTALAAAPPAGSQRLAADGIDHKGVTPGHKLAVISST